MKSKSVLLAVLLFLPVSGFSAEYYYCSTNGVQPSVDFGIWQGFVSSCVEASAFSKRNQNSLHRAQRLCRELTHDRSLRFHRLSHGMAFGPYHLLSDCESRRVRTALMIKKRTGATKAKSMTVSVRTNRKSPWKAKKARIPVALYEEN